MRLNKAIVCRQDADGALLFNPHNGTLTRINRSGLCIWELLQKGLSEPEIVAQIQEWSETDSTIVAHDVHQFLGMLAGKHYLSEFAGVACPVCPGNASALHDRPLYEMSSMKRVFVPGDALELQSMAFGDFQKGDIVTFYPNGLEQPGIVHRVIARNATELITMGDNNPAPDVSPVTTAEQPRLVIAKIRPDGKRFAVKRGVAGLWQFRINRTRRFLRIIGSKMVNRLLPLMFWRKELNDSTQFGEVVQYYYKRRMVAKRTQREIEFVPIWNKLRFKLPKQNQP